MSEVFNPYPYQQYCIDRVIAEPNIGLFLDMGLGKTVITLTAINELKYFRFCVCRALIIAPKKVAEQTWSMEAARWEHLHRLRVQPVLGSLNQRVRALNTPADVYVINRENTMWLAKYYGNSWPFDMVVLDESSSFKNHRAVRFKALKAVRPHINRLVELTGTPSPHGLTDLWSQIYLLDGGKRLGRTISVYRDMYFVPDKRNRSTIFSYAPKEGAEEEIYRMISDICVSMKSNDYLQLPDLMYDDIPVVLDGAAQKMYAQMERDMLIEIDDELITANTAAVLTGKLLQMCNGAVYDEDGNVQEIHRCKIEVLLETVEQLNGQHAIIYYHFRHDRDRILAALSSTGLTVRAYTSAGDADDWNAGKIDILLAQPASCGYGLNLQYGGHHVIWFGQTWSLEEYQQANKRLHRQGQPYPVFVHSLFVKNGMDEEVMRSLKNKNESQEALLDALKARIARVKGGREV